MKAVEAIYTEVNFPDFQNNPLIEALPPKVSDEKVTRFLEYYPEYQDKERLLEPHDRVDYLSRLKQLTQVLPIHIEVFRMIERVIKEGYSAKHPLSPTTQHYLTYSFDDVPDVIPSTGPFEPKGTAITTLGDSGVGKSRLLYRCLGFFPQVIKHKSYKGDKLDIVQVVWLYVQCSHDSSLRGFCHEILDSLDEVLGTSTTPKTTISTLLKQIEQKLKSNFVGVLVIDEIQALRFGKTGGQDNLLKFLLNLINKCGIPIVFAGNMEAKATMQHVFRVARRAESGGYVEIDRLPYDTLWKFYAEELWALQWTNPKTDYDEALSQELHKLSTGVFDIACRVYRQAQLLVIGSDDESITKEVLESAYNGSCKLTDPDLSMYRRRLGTSNQQGSTTKDVENKNVANSDKEKTLANPDPKKIRIAGDLTRPQHPEFSERLMELKNCIDLFDRIVDPDLLRRSLDEEDQNQFLINSGVLCSDPLSFFEAMK
ncbi:ATP-binding protein [Endozoicomonas acroporae]|uniref:ATP-binding protein n=1 Tax=Endozoicomonas acroporae TaxID=1701104 RepID=UPI003D7AEB21